MPRLSRRSLLTASGSALLAGVAGCIDGEPSASDPSDDPTPTNTPVDESPTTTATPDEPTPAGRLPTGLNAAFEYVFPPEDGSATVQITDPTEDQRRYGPILDRYVTDGASPAWVIVTLSGPVRNASGGIVATGSFTVDESAAGVSANGHTGGFDRYSLEAEEQDRLQALATDGETLLLGPSEWVQTTLSRAESGDDTYLDATPGARSVLAAVGRHRHTGLSDSSERIESMFRETAIVDAGLPTLVASASTRSDETITFAMAARYEEPPEANHREAFARFAGENLGVDDPEITVRDDENILVFTASRSYTPPEERPRTASIPRFQEYDEATGEVLFRLGDGDQLPVEHFEIAIEEETYDGDWARGQETIGEGDVVAIDADAIAPGDQFTISYEAPNGSYGSTGGTSALNRLPFDIDVDPDARTGTLTYVEGPPLAADRLGVAVGRDGTAHHPWSGTVEEGDSTELSALPLEGHVRVTYQRSDGRELTIGHAGISLPGEFRFDYDGAADRLTVTYPDVDQDPDDEHPGWTTRPPTPEPLDASRYEIRVDGASADRQWTDVAETIDPGDSLALADIAVGTTVSIAWLDTGGTPHTLVETTTVPDVSFSFGYDRATETVTVRHAGGDPVDPGPLAIRLHPGDRTVAWPAAGAVEQGDEREIENVGTDVVVLVTYGDRDLDHVHVGELLADGSTTDSEAAADALAPRAGW